MQPAARTVLSPVCSTARIRQSCTGLIPAFTVVTGCELHLGDDWVWECCGQPLLLGRALADAPIGA